MAAMIAAGRTAPLSSLLGELRIAAAPLLLRPSAAASARRLNTSVQQLRDYEDDGDDAGDRHRHSGVVDAARRSGAEFPGFFPDGLFFTPPRSVSQMLNLMDHLADANPFFVAGARRGGGPGAVGGVRRGWEAREDAEALRIRVDMPGLGKEHVKVWAEENTLVIRGEAPPEEADGAAEPQRYGCRIELPAEGYEVGEIKAEMKNGVLKVAVPKVKEGRKGVFHVNVE